MGMTMIDILSQLDSVSRELRETVLDGEVVRVQVLAQNYPVPIAEAWSALTDAARVTAWFQPMSGDLRVGGQYQNEGNAGGTILACEPPSGGRASYRVTWEFGGNVSWLTVRLTAADDDTRTRCVVEHVAPVSGIPAEMWDTFGPGATGVGWDGGLLGLALHLGTQDASLAPADAEEWAATEEGKSFYRGAASRWADAHVASGADPEFAGRAAGATAAFYTGEAPPQ